MVLPHHPEFAHRRRIFWGTTIACASLALVAPDLSLPMRLAAPGVALLAAAMGFVVGWLPLKVQALLWSKFFPGLIGLMCLGAFYFFSIGIIINLIAYPFMAAELNADGVTWGKLVMILPAGVGAAAGAHRVFSDLIVVV